MTNEQRTKLDYSPTEYSFSLSTEPAGFDYLPQAMVAMRITRFDYDLCEAIDARWGTGWITDNFAYFEDRDHALECAVEFEGSLGSFEERVRPPRAPTIPKFAPPRTADLVIKELRAKERTREIMAAVHRDRQKAVKR